MEEKIDIRSIDRAEELVSAITDSQDQKEKMLYKCADSILSKNQTQISGSADAFHNFAVLCVRTARDYLTAYEIVTLGLTLHRTNTDLLADALKYGYNCSEMGACADYYSTLKGIEKKHWTWRAFSFSIDYLCEIFNSDGAGGDEMEKEIKELAIEYRKHKPEYEDSLFCQYEVEFKFGNKEEAFKLLEDAVKSSIPYPKCMLKYSDIMIEQGQYEAAARPIFKLLNNPQAAESVNIGYVHYLKGLCQMALLKPTESDDLFAKFEYDEEKVNMIYDSFRCALKSSDLYGSLKVKIKKSIEELSNRIPNVPTPEELDALITE